MADDHTLPSPASRARWVAPLARIHPVVLATGSGLLLGLGVGVLLQQFAVLPLTIGTGVVLPMASAAGGGGATWLVRRRARG